MTYQENIPTYNYVAAVPHPVCYIRVSACDLLCKGWHCSSATDGSERENFEG